MRTAVAALVLGLSLGAAARSADLSDPVFLKAPDRDDWAKAYPAQAAQSGLSGSAQVRCAATAAGSLENCAVVAETPTGAGFGAAALSLMGGMELRPTSQSGQLIAGKSVLVPIKFTPDVLRPGGVVTHPDWLKKPRSEDMAQYWPVEAADKGGKVSVSCVVSTRGLLDNCRLTSEDPAGHGFGAAALAMTPLFLMRPMTVDGQPVGGAAINIPISFGAGGGGGGRFGSTISILRAAPWSASPTLAEMAAAFPKSAIGRIASAHVVMRCAFERDGRLEDCDSISEDPPGHGFANAARSLTRQFRIMVGADDKKITDLRVDVPFDFRDPSQPGPAIQVFNPQWLKTVDPAAAPKLFPESAAKAGLKEGRAIVECEVTHAGALAGCSVVKEDAPGMGFGEAALAVANVMQANLWTAQGTPVEGARIRLPVTLKLPDEPAQAPAAKP